MTSTPTRHLGLATRRRDGSRHVCVGSSAPSSRCHRAYRPAPAVQRPAAGEPAGGRSTQDGALAGDDSSVTETHDWPDDQGTSRSGTVTVSQTKDLATRQMVNI